MKKFLVKNLVIITVLTLILPPALLQSFQPKAKAANDLFDGEEDPGYNYQMLGRNDESDDGPDQAESDINLQPPVNPVPDTIRNIDAFFASNYDFSKPEMPSQSFLWATENLFTNQQRLVLNPADMQDIRILSCLGNVIPDYVNNPDSLAVALNMPLADVLAAKNKKGDEYQKLVERAQEQARSRIVSNLKNDLQNFACIAGVDETTAADMLRYDQESSDAIINYAKDKIVIDKRILKLLVNLVTPKNQGGAGHERIKVYRLRRNYDRDARMYSRESDTIYQKLAKQEQKKQTDELNTIADLQNADKDKVEESGDLQGPEAQAAVVDSYGRSQGELIFTDTKEEKNISTHYKGEAVDISEVDDIRCTLIKKKRLGSDKKIPQPPTPIKLAWQTSEGYDKSPPPNYDSLNLNLKNIASGELVDILDEFGIDADYNQDLSDSSFSDILGMIGEAMIGEIINSPNNSLSGFSLTDTIKKIGGLILADKLDLPREAFLAADITDLSDLETKIGEAVLEKKLGLPFGSIKGTNLDEILTSIGRRHVEAELGVPEGSLTNSMDPASMALSVGRRVLEDELRLPSGTFQSDTTYQKLKQAAGDRKIDLIFYNPSSVDDRLGIDFGITASYIEGRGSPDDYARSIGSKVVNSIIAEYATPSAAGNAMRLAVNQNTALPDWSSTVLANLRFQQIFTIGGDQTGNYRDIGIEHLASALSTNSNTRAAIMKWLNESLFRDDCTLPSEMVVGGVTVTTNEVTGATTTMNVTLPEDQFVASSGLRRGDFFRLFGCKTVKPEVVFKNLGEEALYDSVRNSSLAEQAQAKFLADHPEITSFLRDIEFYRTRISIIKDKVDKIKNDWASFSTDDPTSGAIKQEINNLQLKLATIDVGSLSSAGSALNSIRQITVTVDNIISLINNGRDSENQSLRDKSNATLVDITTIVHCVDEILAGKEQSELSSLHIDEISTIGSNRTTAADTGDGTGISKAALLLMLAGKISPKDLLISVGANKVEGALNLPTNALLYYARFASDASREKESGKDAFFRAIGQAQIEEAFNMPPYFFQGDVPAAKATLSDVKTHVAQTFGISEAEAGAQIMRALKLPGEFSTIEHGQVSSISSIILASKQIDEQLGLKDGTTASFLNGKALTEGQLGNSEARDIAGAFGISESVVSAFKQVLSGEKTLDQAKKENLASRVSYNLHNEFAGKPSATLGADPNNPDQDLSGACPITLRYEQGEGIKFTISDYFEDNSYVYTDNSGATHSFPSMNEARAYAEKNDSKYEEKQFEFIDALAQGMASIVGARTNAGDLKNRLNSFLSDSNAVEAFPDTDLVAYADMSGVPYDTLQALFVRQNLKDIKDTSGGLKPIAPYLETVGRRAAERKIVSALLGSAGLTFGGLKIDATDIYDLLSGNGRQVAYRIGSRYLSEQLNISPTLMLRIIEAPNLLLRQCSLAELGGNFLGSFLGLKTVSLSGNIYENIGGAKIEDALGLPSRSFHGTTLAELINNVGSVNFSRAFGLPAEKVITPAFDDIAEFAANDPMYRQSPQEEMFRQADKITDFPSGATEAGVHDASQQVGRTAADYVSSHSTTESWVPIANPTTNEQYHENQFRTRAATIDGMLGLPQGTTQKLFTGTISPDQYRREVANKVIMDQLPGVLGMLGFDNWEDIYKSYLDVRSLITNIQNCQDSGSCDRDVIFRQLSQLFGVNLDQELGLPQSTLESIIRDPEAAKKIFLDIALSRLDASLGLDPNNAGSFTQTYKNFGCRFPYSGESSCWQYSAETMAGTLFYNYLAEGGILPQPYPNNAGWTSALITADSQALIRGDLRLLQMSAAVKAAEALHIYGDATSPNLPQQYRITYEDIRYAFMGSYGLENEFADRAGKNYLTSIKNQSPSGDITNDSEMTGSQYLYGVQCPPGQIYADCLPVDNPSAFYYTTDSYGSAQSELNSIKSEFAKDYSYDPALDDQATYDSTAGSLSDNDREGFNQAKELAKNKAREDLRMSLMYRMGDAKLYQVDKNFPPGFTRTMLSGSGFEKTVMLTNLVTNYLGSLETMGVSIGDVDAVKAIIGDLQSFIGNPSDFDLDALVQNGKLPNFDKWLTSKLDEVFGVSFQEGTFMALAYGLKTGNYWQDKYLTGNGQEINGLKTIYTDWAVNKITNFADGALGLPAGTAYKTYSMYHDLVAARAALAVAKTADEINNAQQQLTAVKAIIISFVVTTLFSKQIGQVESALGLVPGSGALLVSMAVSYLLGAAISPVTLVIFIAINLFGVYKVELWCTADGYYPLIESPPDSMVFDNGNLGIFNGMDANARKQGFVQAAQYKARTLAGDALMLSERIGDETAIPSQIMVGRQEDADYWSYKIDDVICSKIGGCEGTRAGMWKNPQTTSYTHIGF